MSKGRSRIAVGLGSPSPPTVVDGHIGTSSKFGDCGKLQHKGKRQMFTAKTVENSEI